MTDSQRRRVVLLGSTGSIGCQALEVIRAHPERFEVIGLTAGRDRAALERQAAELGGVAHGLGEEASVRLAGSPAADVVLNGIVGAVGLRASLAALEAGKMLALANKESLVAGGALCLDAARRGGGRIIPVDSEHAAIHQCLEGRAPVSVARVVLTASGGPFRKRMVLDDVTPDEALSHPTWSMGPKVTVDSATMMNKGLEIIEAHWLFGMPYERIDVVVHPQSIVHGMVEFSDGSILMQSASTDMRIPIQAALTHPDRIPSPAPAVDLGEVGTLEFEPVDHSRFPCVNLAWEAGAAGATYPAALNAANEEAVNAFLAGLVPFPTIPGIIESVLSDHSPVEAGDADAVMEVDAWARARAQRLMRRPGAMASGGRDA
jgi:1-deoxy-D-xylulose-5-phosphate reductoisomerase